MLAPSLCHTVALRNFHNPFFCLLKCTISLFRKNSKNEQAHSCGRISISMGLTLWDQEKKVIKKPSQANTVSMVTNDFVFLSYLMGSKFFLKYRDPSLQTNFLNHHHICILLADNVQLYKVQYPVCYFPLIHHMGLNTKNVQRI